MYDNNSRMTDCGRGGHVTSASIPALACGANGSPFALPLSAIGWKAFSKNRVKLLLLLD
jgi:hypothetical protein